MPKYAILANPGHNRVYFEESKKLAAAELTLALGVLSVKCGDPSGITLAGIYYLVFEAEDVLDAADVALLARLSFTYAIFRMAEADGEAALLPVSAVKRRYIGEDVGTILKYTGKTNELFTRMMINAALLSSGKREAAGLRLFDPVAGKGTTLFEGLIYGMDVYGVEIGDRPVADASHHLQKYLQLGKYKHSMKTERISGENKSFTALRRHFEIAADREAAKRGEYRVFELIAGDSRHSAKLYRKSFFDIIVADLPYGVQHGSVTNEGQSALTRSPAALLTACLPAWRDVLKIGGTAVFAFNLNTLPRKDAERIIEASGLTVLHGGAYDNMAHRVDQAIRRDVIFARKQRAAAE